MGVEAGIECQLLAKCEFMNMGGSIKVLIKLCDFYKWFYLTY